MQATRQGTPRLSMEGMDVLVVAELMRLERDRSRLERLYEQLPNATSEPIVGERFLKLWSDVEQRADRLEFILDHMA
jgi:hypothetical protein